MSSSMNVVTMQPPSFSRRLGPSAASRGLCTSVTVAGCRRSSYAPSFRSIKCVSASTEASIVTDTKWLGDASKSTNLIPIYRCIFSDQLTPVLAYRCLVKEDDDEAPSFLFESVEPGSKMSSLGRYSVVGAQPAMEIVAKENKVIVMDHKNERMTEEIIDELESTRRGPYSGGFGGVSFTGDMDIALSLRTIVFPTASQYNTMYSYKDGKKRREWVAYLQAGAGVVADSDPEDEHRECQNKAAGLARAIDLAEYIGPMN